MRTRKYWETRSDELYRDLTKARTLSDLKDKSIDFLLADANSYRVVLTPVRDSYITGSFEAKTCFEYVDEKGIYHSHIRDVNPKDIEVLSTSKETAILRFRTTPGQYTYWILNKALETVSEISQELLLDICDAEVRRLIKHGK